MMMKTMWVMIMFKDHTHVHKSKSVKQSFDTKNEFCPLGHILSASGTFINMSARAFLPPLKCKNFSETGIGWLANSTKELWREVLNDGKVKFWARSKTACQSNWSCKKKIISTVYVTPPGYRPYPFHPIPPIGPQCYIHLRWCSFLEAFKYYFSLDAVMLNALR